MTTGLHKACLVNTTIKLYIRNFIWKLLNFRKVSLCFFNLRAYPVTARVNSDSKSIHFVYTNWESLFFLLLYSYFMKLVFSKCQTKYENVQVGILAIIKNSSILN